MGANEQFAIGRHDGGIARFEEGIGGDEFEFRIGFENKTISSLGDRVAKAVGDHNGGPVLSGSCGSLEAFFPNGRACFQVDAFSNPGVGVNVDVPVVDRAGADALLGL